MNRYTLYNVDGQGNRKKKIVWLEYKQSAL